MATSKLCHSLISEYNKFYEERFGHLPNPLPNRNRGRWQIENILQDLTADRLVALIEFYVMKAPNPTFEHFASNYEKVLARMGEAQRESAARKQRLEETARRAEEWRKRGNTGITGH